MVEKTTGQYIKALWSDRGEEYLFISFTKFYEEQGIKRFLTTPYSPDQNGIAERKNRTIINMVRSMLKSKNMPKEFWAEVVQCAVYIQNRCPHVKLMDMTPQECWSGVKRTVSHFKVFGSVAYARVPGDNLCLAFALGVGAPWGHHSLIPGIVMLLRPSGTIRPVRIWCPYGIYADRYNDRSKAFRLHVPIEKKVTVSRDVYVNEESTWDWNNWLLYKPRNKIQENIPKMAILATPNDQTVVTTNSKNEDELVQQQTRSLQDLYESTTEMHLVCLVENTENITFEESIISKKWKEATDKEINAIERNKIWEMAQLPKGQKPIGVKWVYKKKMNVEGEVHRMETIRLLVSLAAQSRWKIYQMDVKSAFLNGVLDGVVYIEQPPGYAKVREETKILKLKKVLYGLKQAPRAWNTRIDTFSKRIGNLLWEFKNQQDGLTDIKVDNKSAIELARNPVHHERSKHIDVRFHFIREHIRNREVQLNHVMSRDQTADICTKALPGELFNLCKQTMRMKYARDLSLRGNLLKNNSDHLLFSEADFSGI
ncbi:retrovirus-related pol polyprotein from transposon TNT 1-94 [Tanacetum coccineum]